MRQLSFVLLVAVAAHAAADAGFGQQYNQYNSGPSAGGHSYQQQLQAKPSGLSAIWSRLTGSTTPNRRQGIFDELDFEGLVLTVFLLFGGLLLGLVGFSFLSAALSSSGRGLDTDEWEVDHSIWMEQLERDFEDSWKVE